MALRHFYRKHPESVEISLESIGESPQRTQPTVLVVCSSVSKVRAILKRKLGILFDGTTGFALKVCRGQVLRSRNRGVGRSMGKGGEGESDETAAVNPDFQERPQNGASIGAWIGDRHLPPVSFGGLIMVDDRPYGMTVHHMLDDPDQDLGSAPTEGLPRSMASQQGGVPDLAAWYAEQYQGTDSEAESSGSESFACEFSDTDSDSFSESAITSELSDEEESGEERDLLTEPGDIPGIEPGCGDEYIVTQPALDDVEEGFYPSAETQDEDHLDTYSLGEVYASSGIRRRSDNGLIHEVDWALFEFHDDRLPGDNSIPRTKPPNETGQAGNRESSSGSEPLPLRPTAVLPASSLPGLEVQCVARTSGLQTGIVLATLSSVKIYGRQSPSHTYQISGTSTAPGLSAVEGGKAPHRPLSMGVPGDSGAWIVDCQQGHLCGHVLAWSERKRVAYICPMEVLLKDIAETLDAGEIRLPGGEVVVTGPALYSRPVSRVTDLGEERDDASPIRDSWEAGTEGNRPDLPAALWNSDDRQQALSAESKHGDNEEDSYDEGVDMLVADEMNKLQVSGGEILRDRVPVR